MTDKPARCGAKHPKQTREVCTRELGHVGMHSNGGNVTWKKAAAEATATKPEAARPLESVEDRVYAMIVAEPGRTAPQIGRRYSKAIAKLEADSRIEWRDDGWWPVGTRCSASRNNVWHEPATCGLKAGHDGDHVATVTVSDGWPETGETRRIAWDKHGHGTGNDILAKPAPMTLEDEPEDPEADEAALAAMDADAAARANLEPEEDDDPLDDEIRSDEERDFARKMREEREAHAAAQSTAEPPPQSKPTVKVHPAADVFPMLEGEEYEALREDIRQNGVRVRPVLDADGLLVDGRNRLRACDELGITPVFDRLPAGADVVDFVISANLRRRHLNASQRAMFADAVANLRQGRQKQTGGTAGLTQQQAAQRFGVSERSVREARVVRESAAPEVVGAVEQGKLSVDAAAKLAKLPKDKQQAIYEREIKPKKDMVRGGKIKALTKQEEKRAVVRKINQGQVAPMPAGRFGVIYADYPWLYENSDQHDGSRGHMGYPPMTMDEILAHAREAAKRAAMDCIVALWVTNLYIPQIGRVLEAYGAEHRTVITWPKPRAGVGTWPRGQTEHLVIASVGSPVHTLNEISTLLPSWKPEHPGEHSSKPAEVAGLLAKHCGGPFLELFGRGPRDGWTVWGAEVDKFATEAA